MLYKNIFCFFVCSLICIPSVFASTLEQRMLELSANIENESFFAFSIDEFYFKDKNLTIEVDPKKNELVDRTTKLIVSTDVPSSVNLGIKYIVESQVLASSCINMDGNVIVEDFAHYYLGEDELFEGLEVLFDDFEKDRDVLRVEKDFFIKFDSINNLVKFDEDRCSGEVILTVGLDF